MNTKIIFRITVLVLLIFQCLQDISAQDTLTIHLTGYHSGEIAWNSSSDSLTWNVISGETSDSLYEIINQTTWFRAVITDGTCEPIITGTVKAVIQLLCGDTLLDTRDGRKYPTVQIGSQCWMAGNLNYGQMITATNQTNNSIPEKYCYQNDSNNCTTNGALYQWNELMNYSTVQGSQGLCPSGWHVPTDAEYTTLSNNYPLNPGTELEPGGSSGFNLQFAGYTYFSGSGWIFASQGSYCNLRSSTTGTMSGYAYVRYTYPGDGGFYSSTYPHTSGYSARCIRD